MKLRVLLFAVLSFVFTQVLWSANTRLSILRPTSSVTHQWEYLPSGKTVTQQGLGQKQYPLVQFPEVTYLQSELIPIEGCDMGVSVRYYVSTVDTHAIKFELIDATGNVIYSYVNDKPDLNASTMTIGDKIDIGIIEGVDKARIRLSLSDAYSEKEAIYIDEMELYSKNGAGINDIIILDPIKLNIEPQTLIVNSNKSVEVKVFSLNGMLVRKNAICSGTNRIILSAGFYIIEIDDKRYKVVIP